MSARSMLALENWSLHRSYNSDTTHPVKIYPNAKPPFKRVPRFSDVVLTTVNCTGKVNNNLHLCNPQANELQARRTLSWCQLGPSNWNYRLKPSHYMHSCTTSDFFSKFKICTNRQQLVGETRDKSKRLACSNPQVDVARTDSLIAVLSWTVRKRSIQSWQT